MQGAAFLVGEVITFVVSNQVNNRSLRQGCRLVEHEPPLLDMGSERVHVVTVKDFRAARQAFTLLDGARRLDGARWIWCDAARVVSYKPEDALRYEAHLSSDVPRLMRLLTSAHPTIVYRGRTTPLCVNATRSAPSYTARDFARPDPARDSVAGLRADSPMTSWHDIRPITRTRTGTGTIAKT